MVMNRPGRQSISECHQAGEKQYRLGYDRERQHQRTNQNHDLDRHLPTEA